MGSADITIAIDVSGVSKEAVFGERVTALEVMMQSLQIMEKSITRQKLKVVRPDIYLNVDLDRFGALEFWRPKAILEAAQPIKDTLRRQLTRMIEARTVDPVTALPAPARPSKPAR